MWSKGILNLGVIWKVGNGASINARRDPWIPNLCSGRISSNISYDSNITVDTLMTDNMDWDLDKLYSRCLPFEAEAIRRVPIAGRDNSDYRY